MTAPDWPMKFTASPDPLYLLSPTADSLAIADQLDARQTQLAALLTMTHGEQGAAFRMLSDPLQDAFMWACATLAAEVQELTEAFLERSQAEARAAS